MPGAYSGARWAGPRRAATPATLCRVARGALLARRLGHRDRAARRYAGQAGAGLRRARGRGAGGLAYSGVKYLYDNIIFLDVMYCTLVYNIILILCNNIIRHSASVCVYV